MQNMSQKLLKGFKLASWAVQSSRKTLVVTTPQKKITRYYKRIIGLLPRTSYKYMHWCLVVVMVEKMDMPFCEKMLAQAANSVLTAGVWSSWD